MSFEDDLKETFRKAELARRDVRRQRLLNEAALGEEPLTDEEKVITESALKAIRRQKEDYAVATEGGYWRKLWRALLGRAK